MTKRSLLLAVPLVLWAAPLTAQSAEPVLFDPARFAAVQRDARLYPLFAAELQRTRAYVDGAIKAGVIVPVPKDPGGGYTHEQHKRNYQAIYNAGLLYRATADHRAADFSRRLLLAYADLYPRLGPHPAKANEAAGRLFWQSLNDAVWLVYSIQGYDAIRDTLNAGDRARIDDLFRRAATFLSQEDAATFDRIHNHATWSCAGVGMTGYVLRDRNLVEAALKGRDRSGRSGFLAQIDQLFSPDGYYAEGPYYQRYALQPFILFAAAIEANDPGLGIFKRRDGLLLKAVDTAIQLTYDGYFFPLNDAMRDKSLRTDELYQAVSIAYGQTGDPGLLSIAKWQNRTTLNPAGFAVARDLAQGKAKPFAFRTALFRDGSAGDQGGVAVMRSGPEGTGSVLVAKNSAMGMGHGHFDKLSWIFYDNGQPVVTDYGAARFLNVESKQGGRYLPENESWAKQTVAHNVLVVDETSNYRGKWRDGERLPPKQLYFSGDGPNKVSTAEMVGAWPGVTFRRTLVMIPQHGGAPLVLDLLRVAGDKPHIYDLPLHYSGHITNVGFPLHSNAAARPVLGKDNGYQHIWVDGIGQPSAQNATLTWLLGDRFYTYRMLSPPGTEIFLGETGANDPNFNLRREPLLMQRVRGASATFVNLLESHGRYDPVAETTSASASQIRSLTHARTGDADIVTISMISGATITIALADSVDPAARHRAAVNRRTVEWTGLFARFNGGGSQ